MDLGIYLKQSRLSLAEFAEKVGVSEASMSRYVAGKRVPRPRIMLRITAASDGQVEANDFVGTKAARPAAPAADTAPPSAARSFRAAHPDIGVLDVLISDVNGVLRGKRLAIDGLDKLVAGEVTMPGSIVVLDITGSNVEATGSGMADGDPDVRCMAVPDTLAPVPWAPRPTAQTLISFYRTDGRPFALDPRHVLAQTARRFDELGLTPVTAVELEFYLLDRAADAQGRPQPPLFATSGRRATETQCYSMDDLDDARAVLDDIADACAVQSIPASVATSEYAPSQFEINLAHQPDALRACDQAVLLKRAIKGVARRHGLEATFMAKPFADIAGSGLHLHTSLLDGDGRNIFDDRAADGETRLRHAIGGLAATMSEAMAVFGPNANSFRRLAPGAYAPLAPSWGVDNRTVALRVPLVRGAASRIEHRPAGADANVYLAAACVLAGIHHGLVNALDPGPPTTGNAYEQHLQVLPGHWIDALRAHDAATVLPDYLGEVYWRAYSACKWQEVAEFNARITPAEYELYLRAL